jgi:hypothetical protein
MEYDEIILKNAPAENEARLSRKTNMLVRRRGFPGNKVPSEINQILDFLRIGFMTG